MSDNDVEAIRAKAEKCHVAVDLSPSTWNVVRKPQSLLTTLSAFDDAANIDNVSMDMLSMGMSDDFDIAIEEGATIVRMGTALFGKRIYI